MNGRLSGGAVAICSFRDVKYYDNKITPENISEELCGHRLPRHEKCLAMT
jgi:hypothetical protein